MSDWWFKCLCILSYIPGYVIVRWMQRASTNNRYPGDELGPGGALAIWLFSPILVPFAGVIGGWFWVASIVFPEKKV